MPFSCKANPAASHRARVGVGEDVQPVRFDAFDHARFLGRGHLHSVLGHLEPRAVAVIESYWRMSTVGDLQGGIEEAAISLGASPARAFATAGSNDDSSSLARQEEIRKAWEERDAERAAERARECQRPGRSCGGRGGP